MPKIIDKSDEQKDAEADVESFHDDLGPFVMAAETTRMAMVFSDACDPDNPIIFANESYYFDLNSYYESESCNHNECASNCHQNRRDPGHITFA